MDPSASPIGRAQRLDELDVNHVLGAEYLPERLDQVPGGDDGMPVEEKGGDESRGDTDFGGDADRAHALASKQRRQLRERDPVRIVDEHDTGGSTWPTMPDRPRSPGTCSHRWFRLTCGRASLVDECLPGFWAYSATQSISMEAGV